MKDRSDLDYQSFVEQVVADVKNSAKEVYRTIGRGHDDYVYEACLCKELHYLGLSFIRLKPLPLIYKGERIEDISPKIQIIVEDTVFVELDSLDAYVEDVENIAAEHMAATLKPVALFINFSVSGEEQMFKRYNAKNI